MKYSNILVNVPGGYIPLKEASILYIKAQGSYTCITLDDKTEFTISKKLKEIEVILNPEQFFRVHHSHIINLSYIKEIRNGTSNLVIMQNGMSLEISKRRKAEFLSLFKKL